MLNYVVSKIRIDKLAGCSQVSSDQCQQKGVKVHSTCREIQLGVNSLV